MSYQDDFKNGFANTYETVKRKYSDAKFPCYGGRYYWVLYMRRFQSAYFYLTSSSLIYTSNCVDVVEIPFSSIKKISVKQGKVFKSSYTVRIVADKKHHFVINNIKNFSAVITGDGATNVKSFIDMLSTISR
jgi:hypothetical protein